MRTALYVILTSVRSFVRLPLNIIAWVSGIVFLFRLVVTGFSEPAFLVFTGVLFLAAALLRHFYDRLIFRLAPDNVTVILPQ